MKSNPVNTSYKDYYNLKERHRVRENLDNVFNQ